MHYSKIIIIALGISLAYPVLALDLYEDTVTNQVFTKPGPNRVKLGHYEKVEEKATNQDHEADKTALKPKENVTPDQEMKTAENKAEQHEAKTPETIHSKDKGILPAGLTYGKKGFQFKTDDGKFSLAIQNRIQARFATPFDRDPRSISQLEADSSSFMIRRARTKLSGHAYWPWLKYYMQYDWSQPILRDLSLTIDKYKWAELWVGRGKVRWNDERVTSSGNQQFVNRSIVNDIFTVDRQQGVQVFGNLFPGTLADFSYALGVFSGEGVGERLNDDDNMLWAGRLQWNPLGGEIEFSQSDTQYHEEPALNFAVAGATNQSRCTAFETAEDSCRALSGFVDPEEAEAGQYRVNQMMEEVRFKWRGFSLLHEAHWKDITDTLKSNTDPERKTNLFGTFIQAGYFPHYVIPLIPKNLEFAGRYAMVDPNTAIDNDLQQEASGVMTYFFDGHSNKVNFQVSHLMLEDPASGANKSDERFWAQWDLSF